MGAGAYLFIFNYPDTAGILTKDERIFIQHRLKEDNDSVRDEAFTWTNVSKAIKDPKIWLYGFSFHTVALPLYTLTLFLVSVLTITTFHSAMFTKDLLPANYHTGTRLHSSRGPAAYRTSLCLCIHSYSYNCLPVRTQPDTRPFYYRMFFLRYYWVHYPLNRLSSGCFLCRSLFCCWRYLPLRCTSLLMAIKQR